MFLPLARLLLILPLAPLLRGDQAPGGTARTPPPTLHQIWETTEVIAYGRAVRIQGTESLNGSISSISYDSTLHIERCWKGGVAGDILVEGGLHSGCGMVAPPFKILGTYIVRLKKLPDRNAYAPQEVLEFRLSKDGAPLAEHPPYTPEPFSLFDHVSPTQQLYDERALEIFRFAERMSDHDNEAKRASAQRRMDREKASAEFLSSARADIQRALQKESLSDRKRLLLALQDRLKDRQGAGIDELKQSIIGELRAIETRLSDEIKSAQKIAR